MPQRSGHKPNDKPKKKPKSEKTTKARGAGPLRPLPEGAVWSPEACSRERWEEAMRGMPDDALPADLTKQAPISSYSYPEFWYRDEERTCVDCGAEFVFSAKDQKFWYEVARIPLHATANRCLACRHQRREAKRQNKAHMEKLEAERTKKETG